MSLSLESIVKVIRARLEESDCHIKVWEIFYHLIGEQFVLEEKEHAREKERKDNEREKDGKKRKLRGKKEKEKGDLWDGRPTDTKEGNITEFLERMFLDIYFLEFSLLDMFFLCEMPSTVFCPLASNSYHTLFVSEENGDFLAALSPPPLSPPPLSLPSLSPQQPEEEKISPTTTTTPTTTTNVESGSTQEEREKSGPSPSSPSSSSSSSPSSSSSAPFVISHSSSPSAPFVISHSISTYPFLDTVRGVRAGEPICDFYEIELYENRHIFAIADGCNWGNAPRNAAKRACTTAVRFLKEREGVRFAMGNNLLGVAFMVLRSIMVGHTAVFDGLDAPDDAGGTTLISGIALQIDRDSLPEATDPNMDWAVVIAGVGDCKGYLCCDGDILAHDMTPENRSHGSANDSGGRIGFFRDSLFPDLRNLHLSIRFCRKGDYFFGCSDGIHDNLDPEHLGLTPQLFCALLDYQIDISKPQLIPPLLRPLCSQTLRDRLTGLVREQLEAVPGSLSILLKSVEDKGPSEGKGDSEMYWSLTFGDRITNKSGRRLRTPARRMRDWDFEFDFDWKDERATLQIQYFEKEKFGDDLAGEVTLAVKELVEGAEEGPVEKNISLHLFKKQKLKEKRAKKLEKRELVLTAIVTLVIEYKKNTQGLTFEDENEIIGETEEREGVSGNSSGFHKTVGETISEVCGDVAYSMRTPFDKLSKKETARLRNPQKVGSGGSSIEGSFEDHGLFISDARLTKMMKGITWGTRVGREIKHLIQGLLFYYLVSHKTGSLAKEIRRCVALQYDVEGKIPSYASIRCDKTLEFRSEMLEKDEEVLEKFAKTITFPISSEVELIQQTLSHINEDVILGWFYEKVIAENAITQNPPVRICPLNEVLESSLDHCTQTTASSREFMESKIRKKLPSDYISYPGKMDHTTLIGFAIGGLNDPSVNEGVLMTETRDFSSHPSFSSKSSNSSFCEPARLSYDNEGDEAVEGRKVKPLSLSLEGSLQKPPPPLLRCDALSPREFTAQFLQTGPPGSIKNSPRHSASPVQSFSPQHSPQHSPQTSPYQTLPSLASLTKEKGTPIKGKQHVGNSPSGSQIDHPSLTKSSSKSLHAISRSSSKGRRRLSPPPYPLPPTPSQSPQSSPSPPSSSSSTSSLFSPSPKIKGKTATATDTSTLSSSVSPPSSLVLSPLRVSKGRANSSPQEVKSARSFQADISLGELPLPPLSPPSSPRSSPPLFLAPHSPSTQRCLTPNSSSSFSASPPVSNLNLPKGKIPGKALKAVTSSPRKVSPRSNSNGSSVGVPAIPPAPPRSPSPGDGSKIPTGIAPGTPTSFQSYSLSPIDSEPKAHSFSFRNKGLSTVSSQSSLVGSPPPLTFEPSSPLLFGSARESPSSGGSGDSPLELSPPKETLPKRGSRPTPTRSLSSSSPLRSQVNRSNLSPCISSRHTKSPPKEAKKPPQSIVLAKGMKSPRKYRNPLGDSKKEIDALKKTVEDDLDSKSSVKDTVDVSHFLTVHPSPESHPLLVVSVAAAFFCPDSPLSSNIYLGPFGTLKKAFPGDLLVFYSTFSGVKCQFQVEEKTKDICITLSLSKPSIPCPSFLKGIGGDVWVEKKSEFQVSLSRECAELEKIDFSKHNMTSSQGGSHVLIQFCQKEGKK